MIYLFAKREEDPSRAAHSNIVVPAPEGKKFLPYQLAGIEYLINRGDVLNADQMGLGKTCEAIGVSNMLPDYRAVLIVCPATLKQNWENEWVAWDTKNLTVGIVRGKELPATDVIVINYDLLRKFRAQLRERRWDILIVDECHYAKNKKAIRTREVLGGIKRNQDKQIIDRVNALTALKRMYLSGTPLRRPKDIWPLLQVIDPDGLGSNWHVFAKCYCGLFEIKDYQGKRIGWKWDGATNLEELQKILRERVMLRRLKADVLKELPPKRRQIILLEGTKKIDKLLESERMEYDKYKRFEGDLDVAFGDMAKLREEVGLAKIPYVIEYLEEILDENEKVVVFARHHSVIDRIAAAFGSACVVLDGRTPIEDRAGIVSSFQRDVGIKIFVGSIKAAGVGITLTVASLAIFAELEWLADDISQAEDRLHRVTQTRGVNIQHLIWKLSLDEKIISNIIAEQERIDEALDKRAE